MMASVHCFFSFYIFGHFFTIYLCRFALLEVLLSKLENIFFLIELKDKLLHCNKITSLCHWIALLDNNNMFPKNAFLNLEIFWKISLKNTDISILVLLKWIVCLIYPLYNLITFLKLISHAFWTMLQ